MQPRGSEGDTAQEKGSCYRSGCSLIVGPGLGPGQSSCCCHHCAAKLRLDLDWPRLWLEQAGSKWWQGVGAGTRECRWE